MKVKSSGGHPSWNVYDGGQRYRYDPYNNYMKLEWRNRDKEYYSIDLPERVRYPEQKDLTAKEFAKRQGPGASGGSEIKKRAQKIRSNMTRLMGVVVGSTIIANTYSVQMAEKAAQQPSVPSAITDTVPGQDDINNVPDGGEQTPGGNVPGGSGSGSGSGDGGSAGSGSDQQGIDNNDQQDDQNVDTQDTKKPRPGSQNGGGQTTDQSGTQTPGQQEPGQGTLNPEDPEQQGPQTPEDPEQQGQQGSGGSSGGDDDSGTALTPCQQNGHQFVEDTSVPGKIIYRCTVCNEQLEIVINIAPEQ